MPWWQEPTYDGIQIYLYKNIRLFNWSKCNQAHSHYTTKNTVFKLFFLLKNPIFNILSDIVSDLTSSDIVVFVVRRRLVLSNFEELQ